MPRHLTDELHLFSLEDLVRVKKGLLVSSLKDVLKASLEHVACCEVRFAGGRCVPELSFMHQGLFWVLCTFHDLTLTDPEGSADNTISRWEKCSQLLSSRAGM